MAKVAKVRVTRQACGNLIGWARGKRFSWLRDEEQAGQWIQFMVSDGIKLHERTDIQPSGVMPEGWVLRRCVQDLEEINEPHPDKGKTREQIEQEVSERRLVERIRRYDEEHNPKPKRDYEAETMSVVRLLMSYKPGEFSLDKFGADLSTLENQYH